MTFYFTYTLYYAGITSNRLIIRDIPMATLTFKPTADTLHLFAQHIFGRHPTANTVLTNAKASRIHATISWDGENWLLKDSSTNGTFINGKRLQRDAEQTIKVGQTLCFADPAGSAWRVTDVTPPKCLLVPQTTDGQLIVLEDMLILPDESSPEITLYRSTEGRWVCETDSNVSILSNRDKVGTKSQIWQFVEPLGCEETQQEFMDTPVSTAQIELFIDVSQDEEHVRVKISALQQHIDLEERNHHYLLLLLARKLLEDQASGLPKSEQGWIEREQLANMQGLCEVYFNIQLSRLRKQVDKSQPPGLLLPPLIEKRRGQIRLLYPNIHITGGLQPLSATV
jgi:hypothetical protein